MHKRKVLIVNGNHQYHQMFIDAGFQVVENLFEADLVQFTGGSDVTPDIYGEPNQGSYIDTGRDFEEAGVFAIAQRLGLPCTGICRGGQFLNVMSGGKMHQNVEGHANGQRHSVTTADGESVLVSSTHHQIMIPSFDALMLAWADEHVFPDVEQVEAVYYEHTKSLCFQPHPEFDRVVECRNLYFKYINKYLF